MSYKSLTDNLVTILKAMTRFATADIAKGDDRILGHGKSDCVILYPGPFSIEPEGEIDQGREDRTWIVYMDLFQRVATNPGADWESFEVTRDDVIATLRKYPNLGQTAILIKNVGINASSAPQHVFNDKGQGPIFIVQRLEIEIVENTTASGGDYS